MDSPANFLIMIQYPTNVGFAIGRLVGAFYEMASQCAGSPSSVHFSFSSLAAGPCPTLPSDFSNLVVFDPRNPTPEAVGRLVDYVRTHQVNVVFGLDISVQAPYLHRLRQAGVRIVLSYYGAPLGTLLPKWLLRIKRLEVEWLRPNKPDHFILESEAIRRTAIFGRGIRPEATSVVRTGVRLEQFTPSDQDHEVVYQAFSIPKNRKIVVYVGHFHRRKGVHVLLKAAHKIVIEWGRDDIHFLFLGNRDDDVEKIATESRLSEIEHFITLAGYQTNIAALLAGCKIGCIPSTGWDSFPMASLEMQACRLPVVVSDCQGVPETIVDGITGMVVPAGDDLQLAQTISQLMDSPDRRARMSLAARRHVEEHLTYEAQLAHLTEVVNATLAL